MKTDFVVIGSGIAGLNSALLLSRYGKVLIVTKGKARDSSTNLAQGGIAAVVKKGDSFEKHIDDTLRAGSYHNNRDAVSFLVSHAKSAIDRLEELGVVFDHEKGKYQSSFEAAHSYPRVLHASDFTGAAIERTMLNQVRKNPRITLLPNTSVVRLLTRENICCGVAILRNKNVISVPARATVLATGGAGQLWSWTTNPIGATGDGIALAYQVGAELSDLEFVQFHPTAFKQNASPLFLLSEALRGEGALVVDEKDREVVDPLLPRDQVARAIFHQQKKGNVFLDIRHKGRVFLHKRFPNIYTHLKQNGYDLAVEKIPITPGAHFMCGGVKTDLYGRTSITNLFAYGEVACTGVHGANRLASNSLLEGMVFSSQIETCIDTIPKEVKAHSDDIPRNYHIVSPVSSVVKDIMWHYVGIERTERGLQKAILEFEKMDEDSMVVVARLITESALKRKKSLGTHFIKSQAYEN